MSYVLSGIDEAFDEHASLDCLDGMVGVKERGIFPGRNRSSCLIIVCIVKGREGLGYNRRPHPQYLEQISALLVAID